VGQLDGGVGAIAQRAYDPVAVCGQHGLTTLVVDVIFDHLWRPVLRLSPRHRRSLAAAVVLRTRTQRSRTLRYSCNNKKSELMLMRRTTAYSSSCSRVVLVYLHSLRRSSLLKCAPQPKIAKTHQNPLFWRLVVIQGHQCWYPEKARHQCLLS